MPPAIVLTSPNAARELYYGEAALAGLQALGRVLINPGDAPWSLSELIDVARDATIIVSDRQTPAPGELFDALPKLHAFVRCAVDIRNVDVEAATRNGTLVTHASPGFLDSVAELVIGYMIDLARKITTSTLEYRRGSVPNVMMGRQLAGSQVGIIGFGAIGERLAQRCHSLGMTVLINDPFVNDLPRWVEPLGLHELLNRSDFNVCLAVANKRTENLIDAQAFAAMRRGSYFINVSRGNLVDETALLAALNDKNIAGCAMDVGLGPDQMPTLALASHENVIATPHIGGLTPQAISHQALETVGQVKQLLAGNIPQGTVNA